MSGLEKLYYEYCKAYMNSTDKF